MHATPEELLQFNHRLLESIFTGDWDAYRSLCAEDLTCFEPEALGHLVVGMDFHKFYFDLAGGGGPRNVTMANPKVRILGDEAAVVAYTRLVQKLNADGVPVTVRVEETRVWQYQSGAHGGRWKMVHVHRSTPAS